MAQTLTTETPEIRLANPRGFCAGVDRAIDIVNRALDIFGAPIFVRHEVVHNKFVVEALRKRGAVFVEELSDIPETDERGRSCHCHFQRPWRISIGTIPGSIQRL